MSKPPCRPRRKALLIGINYDTDASPKGKGYEILFGPRKDALDFKILLIDKYSYEKDDITVMIDSTTDQCSVELQPTYSNILRQTSKLVRDAQPGDHLVFLFSGHSSQITCKEHTEDDGYDEVILPMDHNGDDRAKLIVDNDLRRLLVDPLPVGAYLTAILDSCHSGTLLDLDHYRCNRILCPWISKGIRYQTKSMCRNIVREYEMIPSTLGRPLTIEDLDHSLRGSKKRSSLKARSLSKPVSPQNIDPNPRANTATSISSVLSTVSVGQRGRIRHFTDKLKLSIPRCMSPESMDLIAKLREEPNTTLGQLMSFLSYQRYDVLSKMHMVGNRYLKRCAERGVTPKRVPPELVNFQNPQLGSQETLWRARVRSRPRRPRRMHSDCVVRAVSRCTAANAFSKLYSADGTPVGAGPPCRLAVVRYASSGRKPVVRACAVPPNARRGRASGTPSPARVGGTARPRLLARADSDLRGGFLGEGAFSRCWPDTPQAPAPGMRGGSRAFARGDKLMALAISVARLQEYQGDAPPHQEPAAEMGSAYHASRV
ncbi:hypothetical protein WOLCODRAFT_165973 [Wolfiporia cocos MD-104 SS10]|uniref:Peptidase C14 caspase domain-containing protein n=1 Tax=Wolfiporia cocos (strain MD-104) TaxID=742152 RepID=A0A2H3IZ79_WOLCO|nr:hypothetical protein WOLCODRAFT_165973 [Wolfiporia cocos MD-104 SS10]